MKIYIDGIIYNAQKIGGISRYFNEMLNRVTQNNTNIDVKVVLYNGSQKGFLKTTKVSFDFVSMVSPIKPYRIFRPLTDRVNSILRMRYWKNIHDGVFHSTYFTLPSDLEMPQVLTIHDMIYEKFPQFFSNRSDKKFIIQKKKCIDAADKIICVSENTRKDLLSYYNIPKNKISVIPLGVSTSFREIPKNDKNYILPSRINSDIQNQYILYVGTRNLYKNFLLFLKAYHRMNIPNLDLVVVGGGKFSRSEQTLLKKMNIMAKIHNLNYVSDDELTCLYNHASIFVFPSLYEGFGIPLLEAMACGTPIAAANSSSLPEVGGDAALYFDPNSLSDMVSIMKCVLLEGRQSPRIQKGLQRAKNYTWDTTAKKTLELYKQLSNYSVK